ncbi:MAG: FkbM family methyltransferase [Desulfurococcaceae archaeon]
MWELRSSIGSLVTKFLGYSFNIKMLNINDFFELYKAMLLQLSERASKGSLEYHLSRNKIVKTWDGFLFFVRARSPDLYATAIAERYELEKWFKPLAKGVVVDVGAYIGTYTVRACKSAELVIGIEPLPFNFAVLAVNVKLNDCSNVVLVNKAVGAFEGQLSMFVPIKNHFISFSTASLKQGIEKCLEIKIKVSPLDSILSKLGVSQINLLKIDIEGYVIESLPGMLDTLKKTRNLIIELLKRDITAYNTLKTLGFKLVDRHGHNYLFRKL